MAHINLRKGGINIGRLKKYLLNGVILSCASIAIRGASVMFNAYLTSKIGGEGIGLVTLLGGVYGFFITLATSGISLALTRLISSCYNEDKEGKCNYECEKRVGTILKNGIIYSAVFSISASIILFVSAENIGVHILNDRRTVLSLKALALSLAPISIGSVLNGYFNGVRRVYKTVFVQVLEQTIKMALCFIILTFIMPSKVEYACLTVVCSGVMSELMGLIFSTVLYAYDLKKHTKKSNTVLKIGYKMQSEVSYPDCDFNTVFFLAFPLGVSGYIRSLLSAIEHIAIPWGLKKSGGLNPLSSYGILHGVVFPLLLFPSAILNAFSSLLIPELSSSQSKMDLGSIRKTVSSVISLSLLFSLGVSGVLISYSYEIGYFLYGSKEAGEYIRILSPLIPLMYLDNAVDSMLKGLGEQLYCMRVNIADSLISILLIFTLLPMYGIRGYVAVIFITELFNTSFSLLRLLKVSEVLVPCVRWVLKPLFSIILATIIGRIIFKGYLTSVLNGTSPILKRVVILEIAFTSFVYVLLCAVLGTVFTSFIKYVIKKLKNRTRV